MITVKPLGKRHGLAVDCPPGPDRAPPTFVASAEATYIRALLDAYEDRLRCPLVSVASVSDPQMADHLQRSRREFYCAESLRQFSKDNVPGGTFEGLLEDVHNGVIDTVQASH